MNSNNSSNKTNQTPLPSGGAGGGLLGAGGGLLVFCTNNAHKLSEIRAILGEQFEVLSLKDIGCDVDIPETGTTLEENALLKARYVWDHYHLPCFADDTGLEVDALDGAPGVYSARYAAVRYAAVRYAAVRYAAVRYAAVRYAAVRYAATMSQPTEQPTEQPASHDSEANMRQLLEDLGENNNRHARFRTVIALITEKKICPCGCNSIKQEQLFEGIIEGEITRERSGAEGFGYDPIFRPDGYDKTFAELGTDIKNKISHRARATQKLCEKLKIEN